MFHDIKNYIRTIENFPKEGVQFRDITSLFSSATGFRKTVDALLYPFIEQKIDVVIGIDARGFILGGALAHQLGASFVPARKKGKLPGYRIAEDYQLEYGEATLEMHVDSLCKGQRVLLVDDLLATWGTAEAAVKLIQRLQGEIAAVSFVIELPALGGRQRLESYGVPVTSLCSFDD